MNNTWKSICKIQKAFKKEEKHIKEKKVCVRYVNHVKAHKMKKCKVTQKNARLHER